MRKQFVNVVTTLMAENDKIVLLLCDIGVHAFRECFARFPDRTFNIGILEQSTTSIAAGWAMQGYIPIVHTIAPFLVERAYEQLKIDFGYQGLKGIFVSVGASHDYASLGCTHHCPADVALMENIPGFSIYVPGHATELGYALRQAVENTGPTYIRISNATNPQGFKLGLTHVIATRTPTILAVGPAAKMVSRIPTDLLRNFNYIYTNSVRPFSALELDERVGDLRFVVVEPYYSSTIGQQIADYYFPQPVAVKSFAVPRIFYTDYSDQEVAEKRMGFTPDLLQNLLSLL